MITYFRGKVYANKAVRMNLKSKYDYFINTFNINKWNGSYVIGRVRCAHHK
jgi:hypothetical protein